MRSRPFYRHALERSGGNKNTESANMTLMPTGPWGPGLLMGFSSLCEDYLLQIVTKCRPEKRALSEGV